MNNQNLNKHAISLEFDRVLKRLSDFAQTKLGKQKCLNSPIHSHIEQVKHAILQCDEARKILDDRGDSNAFVLDFLCNSDEILKNHKLSSNDIINLTKNLKSSRLAKNFISKCDDAHILKGLSANLYTDKEFEDKIFSMFDSNLNLLDSASAQLHSLRTSLKDTKDHLKASIHKLLSSTSFTNHLQDTTPSTRDNRTVFQVKASDKNKIKGIIHDKSATNLTFFVEPQELIPINNKIRQIEVEILGEIERILFELSKEFHNIKNEMISIQNVLSEFDFIFARARYSVFSKATSPVITHKKVIKIEKMRHPLLIDLIDNIVENDFELGENFNSLIITGSNTGGKTVAIKCVGLFVLMSKSGLHLPCVHSEIFPFDNIFVDISTEQNLVQSLSTFSAHIKNISSIVNEASENSLVIFDELGAGTDPTEGAALSRSILEHLSNKNILTISTTHLGELKVLKYENSNFENASVVFDIEKLKPTYKLNLGIFGSSNALLISKNLELSPEIIEHAQSLLKNSDNVTKEMFSKIEQTHSELSIKEAQTSKIKEESETVQKEYKEKLEDLKSNKKKSLSSFKKKYQSQIDTARAEIKEIMDEMRKEKSQKLAIRSYSRLAELERAAHAQFQDESDKLANKYEPIDWNTIKIGKAVLIKDLEQIATLESLPDKKNKVIVSIGLIKTTVDIKKLAMTDKKVKKNIKKIDVSFDDIKQVVQNRIDVRGQRVEEAIDYIDKHFDLASLKRLHEITIVHGHGTGALKSAIRDYLKSSPYVAKFRSGNETEGLDGVTIVDII